jgi:hypothetical protein
LSATTATSATSPKIQVIQEPTCLILGAGASAPYGLPTTDELRDLILSSRSPTGRQTAAKFPVKGPQRASLTPGDPVNEWTIYLNEVTDAANLGAKTPDFRNKFFRADQSIDWFIRDNEASFGDIARLQIAAVLLNCERDDKLAGDWYRLLSKIVFPTSDFTSLPKGNLSIISFNYDRSFERYFLSVLESQFNLPLSEAKAVFDRIDLVHAYGQLGSLDEVPYGDTTKAGQAAEGIRLIRPDTDNPMQGRVGALIRRSTYVNFIGFGFDDQNIKLLGPRNFKKVQRVYSTSVGLSWVTLNKAMVELRVYFDDPKNPPNWTAAQLFAAKDLFGPKRKPMQLEEEEQQDEDENYYPPGADPGGY